MTRVARPSRPSPTESPCHRVPHPTEKSSRLVRIVPSYDMLLIQSNAQHRNDDEFIPNVEASWRKEYIPKVPSSNAALWLHYLLLNQVPSTQGMTKERLTLWSLQKKQV